MRMKLRLLVRGITALIALGPISILLAADEEEFELSPFEVISNDDLVHLANNSLAATRWATAVRDLPTTLEVLASQGLSDIAATDFKGALSYIFDIYTFERQAPTDTGLDQGGLADASPAGNPNVGNFRNNAVSIRESSVPFRLHNGFRIAGYMPSVGINLKGFTHT